MGLLWLYWYMTCLATRCLCSVFMSACMPAEAKTTLSDLHARVTECVCVLSVCIEFGRTHTHVGRVLKAPCWIASVSQTCEACRTTYYRISTGSHELISESSCTLISSCIWNTLVHNHKAQLGHVCACFTASLHMRVCVCCLCCVHASQLPYTCEYVCVAYAVCMLHSFLTHASMCVLLMLCAKNFIRLHAYVYLYAHWLCVLFVASTCVLKHVQTLC
jgi:hypothetical protein